MAMWPEKVVQQIDVAVGVVDDLPVVLPDLNDVEQPTRVDVIAVIVELLRARHRDVRREGLVDLVVDLLQFFEERVAVVGDDMTSTHTAK